MKLLLINPYFEGVKPDAPQFGLYFLGTYIKEHTDWNVEVIDPLIEGLTREAVLNKAKNANMVGLTCFTDIRFQCFDFAKDVKSMNPDCKIIIGGVHATALSKQILEKYPFIDIVIKGEGERALLKIIKNESLQNTRGIVAEPLIENIDHLHLDYSLMPDAYTKYWKDYEVPKSLLRLIHIPIIASRGCPYNCYYCSSHPYWYGKYRCLSPKELVKRMEKLINTYNAEYFRFYDALFPISRQWIDRFCTLIKERNLDIKFRIDVRANTRGYILKQLREVGCCVLGMGIESAVPNIRKKLNKNDSQDQIFDVIKISKDLGYWLVGYFMLGLPGESKKDILQTIKLIKKFDYHNLTRFQIYPNTFLYNKLRQNKEVDDEIWFNRKFNNKINPKTDYFYNIGASSYCRENFSSAPFYQRELDWLLQYSFDYHNVMNPGSVIRKYGLKGVLVVLKALMDIPTRGRVDKLYRKIVV